MRILIFILLKCAEIGVFVFLPLGLGFLTRKYEIPMLLSFLFSDDLTNIPLYLLGIISMLHIGLYTAFGLLAFLIVCANWDAADSILKKLKK